MEESIDIHLEGIKSARIEGVHRWFGLVEEYILTIEYLDGYYKAITFDSSYQAERTLTKIYEKLSHSSIFVENA